MTSQPMLLVERPIIAFASTLAKKGLIPGSRSQAGLRQEQEAPEEDTLTSFNALILQHQVAAYNFAFYLLGDPDTAADATQQAFINAYLHFAQFQGSNFRGWLFKILKNTCIDELRRGKRRPTYSLSTYEDTESLPAESLDLSRHVQTPEQALDLKETSRQIQTALGRLDEPFRTVLILVDVQGMDYQEAAQITRVPIGTLKSRLARARRQFRGVLEQ